MVAETLRPDGQLSCSGLATCVVTEHDQDPDTNSTTIAATGNNTNTEYGVDFPTPSGNPTVGADLQEFRAGVIEFDSGQTGTPDARIELWENGALVRAGSNTPVSVYAVLSLTWNANELATADGSLVQCKVIGTKSGGGPTARNTARIGHIEWNVTFDEGGVTHLGQANLTAAGTITPLGVQTLAGKSALSGAASITPNGVRVFAGAGALSGLATVTLTAGLIKTGIAAIAASAALTAIGSVGGVTHLGQAILNATGAITPKGIGIYAGQVAFSGSAIVTSVGKLLRAGQAVLAASATLTAVGSLEVVKLGQASLSATATLTAVGSIVIVRLGQADLAASAGMTVAPSVIRGGKAVLAGQQVDFAPTCIVMSKALMHQEAKIASLKRLIARGRRF